MLALVVLTDLRGWKSSRRVPRRPLALALSPLALPPAAPLFAPSLLVAALAGLCAVQIAILPKQLVDDDPAGGGDVE
jgi:hypothetical protein